MLTCVRVADHFRPVPFSVGIRMSNTEVNAQAHFIQIEVCRDKIMNFKMQLLGFVFSSPWRYFLRSSSEIFYLPSARPAVSLQPCLHANLVLFLLSAFSCVRKCCNTYLFVFICRQEEYVIYTNHYNCCVCFQCPGREWCWFLGICSFRWQCSAKCRWVCFAAKVSTQTF